MAKGKTEPLASAARLGLYERLALLRRTTKNQRFSKGTCQQCGADLIDWKRVHVRDLDDADNTFKALKNEFIRTSTLSRVRPEGEELALRKGLSPDRRGSKSAG